MTVSFTDPPAAGKAALATLLRQHSHKVEVLDGAEVRKNRCADLAYSKEDRDTNVRRPGFVCGLLTRNGVDAITAAVSPYRQDQG